jgi:hypothetical protein
MRSMLYRAGIDVEAGVPIRPQAPPEARDPHAALACLEWLAQCSTRIAELDPSLAIDAADRIAGYLWSNERLRNMQPQAAADFLFAHPETRQSLPA